jgi:hypothetical protein
LLLSIWRIACPLVQQNLAVEMMIERGKRHDKAKIHKPLVEKRVKNLPLVAEQSSIWVPS